MISAATGALAVNMTSIVNEHGEGVLYLIVIVFGFIEILLGLINIGRFIDMIPASVLLGFVNGLAIVIGEAQFHLITSNWMYLPIVIVTISIMLLSKYYPKIPSSLVGIAIGCIIEYVIFRPSDIKTDNISDIANISGSLPNFFGMILILKVQHLLVILLKKHVY